MTSLRVGLVAIAMLAWNESSMASERATMWFRLAYSADATLDAGPQPALAAPTPDLVDDSGLFLRFEFEEPQQSIANMQRPKDWDDDQVSKKAVFEYWIRFRPTNLDRYRTGGPAPASPGAAAPPDKLCTSTPAATRNVSKAWDAAYQIIAMHGYCPHTQLVDQPSGPHQRRLALIEPTIVDSPGFFERHMTAPVTTTSASSWPLPQCDSNALNNEREVQYWERGLQCNHRHYTGLDDALSLLLQQNPALKGPGVPRIAIAHLDTGYPNPQGTSFAGYPWPAFMCLPGELACQSISADCYEMTLHQPAPGQPDADPCRTGTNPDPKADGAAFGVDISLGDPKLNSTSWFLTNYLHGANTLSILAGSGAPATPPATATQPSNQCDSSSPHVGGDPCAAVFEVRIGQSFAHANEESEAAGIRYAVDNGADLISLSHGGLPAGILAHAVNYAYVNGTPIYAASGDFLGVSFLSTPKTVVYPARYDQVMNITGVTADGLSAGLHCPLWSCIGRFRGGDGFWSNLESWLSATNYAEESVMQNHTVGAYTPNVTVFDTSLKTPAVVNDEPGTSAAVPQAASAAAIWLEYNRANILASQATLPEPANDGPNTGNVWTSWRKSEAVYQAMLHTADPSQPGAYHGLDGTWPSYLANFIGAGVLRAKHMLTHYPYVLPADNLKRCYPSTDIAWWPDFLGSMTLASIMRMEGFATQDNAAVHGEAEVAFYQSSQIELSQIVFRSKKLTELVGSIRDDLVGSSPMRCGTNFDFTKVSPAKWRRLAALIDADPLASQSIRQATGLAIARFH
jgi:hypothetical protein